MNRSATYLTAALALTLVLALIGWWTSRPERARKTLLPHSDTPTADHGINFAIAPLGADQRASRDHELLAQAIEKTNVLINFWGKVVDQVNRPLDGVNVRFNYSTEQGNGLGAAWAKQNIHEGETTTDAAGRFAITGLRGHELTIESLRKEGFRYSPHAANVYDFYGSTATGRFTPSAKDPVLFLMVNTSLAVPLIVYGGNFGKQLNVPGDGTPTRWSLWTGKRDDAGELEITFRREPAVLERVGPPQSWWARIGIVRGGIAAASPDEAVRRAPEEGYTATIDYPQSEQKRGVSLRSFYVRTADRKYGYIQLEFYPGDEGPTARCLIKACMNSTGSRDLEGGL